MTPSPERAAALKAARKLAAAGHTAYFAGGCVRDFLLGTEPEDYDIATSATPAEVLALFPKANEVGAHFGVVIARVDGVMIEIATFRTDGSYRDGRRPETVEFATPEEDARRRDFTINGLFQEPESGKIIDFVGGEADLRTRLLRAIGSPGDRFREDSLRLMRAVRFATRLGFRIEEQTLRSLAENAPLLCRISIERIRDEFSGILASENRRRGIELLVEARLIDGFLPEVRALIGCEQPPEWHPEGDVFVHTMIMLEMLPPDAPLTLCLAVLLHDIGKPPTRTWDAQASRIRFNGHEAHGADMAHEILRRMKYPNEVISAVVHMVSRHMRFMHVQEMRVAKLKRFMAAPCFEQEMELHRVDCASSNGFTDNYEFVRRKQEEFANEPLVPPPLVNGRDLITLGLTPGPRFREILEAIQTEQLEGRLADRAAAMEIAQNMAANPPA